MENVLVEELFSKRENIFECKFHVFMLSISNFPYKCIIHSVKAIYIPKMYKNKKSLDLYLHK